MASRTIENGQCLNEAPHEAHKFRPAIFGLGRKVWCKGVEELVAQPKHKHRLVCQNHLAFIDPLKLVWHCDCGKFISCYRDDFKMALMGYAWYPKRIS